MKRLLGFIGAACALIAMLYMIFSDEDTANIKTKAVDGIIDLRQITDSPFVSLAGDWKFTPDSFTNPAHLAEEAVSLPVPGAWPSDIRWGSYQLVVYLPDQWTEIGLRIRNIWSAHELYINGMLVSKKGAPADSKHEMIPDNRSYEIHFKPDQRQVLLTIHVSNFYNTRGGIVLPIDIGDAAMIDKDVHRDLSLEWAAVLFLLICSMYHLTLYLMRTKDEAFLYSGLHFLLLSAAIALWGDRIVIREFPDLPFELYFRLQDSLTYLSSILLIIFFAKMIPFMVSRRALFLLCLPLLVFAFLNAMLPARTLSSVQYVMLYYMDLLFLILLFRTLYLTMKNRISIRRNEAVILIFMMLFLAMFAITSSSDTLFFTGRNSMNRVGLIGFIMTMNVFLGIRLMNRTAESERLTARLKNANAAKDAFLKVTAQELQRPLLDVVHLVRSIPQEQNGQRQGEQLYLAKQLMENMVYLLRDLHDFTRLRFEDYEIQLKSTNLRMVMLYVIQLMQFMFNKKNIQINEMIVGQLYVWADEQRLTQVLLRVMNEISLDSAEGAITIESAQDGSDVLLIITTTRRSITASRDLQHSSGLMMTQELIQQMNGSVTYERTNTGTRFLVRLTFSEFKEPMAPLDYEYLIRSVAASEERELQNVLIVDDDVMHAEVIKSMLSDTYKIQTVYTIQEALDYYNAHPEVAFVIIDDLIPGEMNSLDLLRQIRIQASLIELPVLMMISSEYPGYIETIFTAGANDYLLKPISKETLMARLNAAEQTKQSTLKAIEYEMAFLQTQIKPHFLYNALSNIISFCYTDGERAAYLLTMLSSFLRYIFESSREGQTSSLQKELEIIEAYVEVEKARFGERLSFAYELDPVIDADKTRIPSLLLQPLVENAIRHGIFNKEGPGHVQVTITVRNHLLHVTITDDGVGMTASQCEELLEGAPANGIGFTNVRRRVHDFTQGKMEIHSSPGTGTTIVLTIPMKGEQIHVENNDRRG